MLTYHHLYIILHPHTIVNQIYGWTDKMECIMSDNKKELKKVDKSMNDDLVDGISAIGLIFIVTSGIYFWLSSMMY